MKTWYQDLIKSYNLLPTCKQKRVKITTRQSEDDEDLSSPDSKISQKGKHFLSAMLKIHDTLDKNMLRPSLDHEEKEPSFARLEQHKKNMILNI